MAPPLLRILIKSRGLAHPPGNLGSSVADGPSVISFEGQPLCWQMALHQSPSCAQHLECRSYVEHNHSVLVEMPVGSRWYESFWLNTSSLQDRGSSPSSRLSQPRHLAAPGTSHPVGARGTASSWRVPSKETFRNGIPVGLS